MATARRTQRTTRRPRITEPRTAAEIAAAAPAAVEMPSAHALCAELEAMAAAAGRYWHALGEAGLPANFRTLMFDNWQASLWGNDNSASLTDRDSEPEGDEAGG